MYITHYIIVFLLLSIGFSETLCESALRPLGTTTAAASGRLVLKVRAVPPHHAPLLAARLSPVINWELEKELEKEDINWEYLLGGDIDWELKKEE